MNHLLLSILACFGLSLHAATIAISGVQTQIFGSTTDVPGSGSAANYDAGTLVGDFAVFDVDRNGSAYADLKVTYLADNSGDIGSDIMIARTSNSQNLMDTGTLSILMNIGSGTDKTASIQFEWYTDGSFVGGVEQGGASLITDQILYTSFDIDFRQVNRFTESDLASYQLHSTTELTATSSSGEISFEDANSNSTFDDPETAFSVLTAPGAQSLIVDIGKQNQNGAALFMFEFNDPPVNLSTPLDGPTISIPEPSTFMFSMVGLAAFVVLRKRQLR